MTAQVFKPGCDLSPPAGAMVLVKYIDHTMSDQPTAHWHDGDLPRPPKENGGVCWAMGWVVHKSANWLQLLHVSTKGQHGHYSELHIGSIKRVVVLEPVGIVEGE